MTTDHQLVYDLCCKVVTDYYDTYEPQNSEVKITRGLVEVSITIRKDTALYNSSTNRSTRPQKIKVFRTRLNGKPIKHWDFMKLLKEERDMIEGIKS